MNKENWMYEFIQEKNNYFTSRYFISSSPPEIIKAIYRMWKRSYLFPGKYPFEDFEDYARDMKIMIEEVEVDCILE